MQTAFFDIETDGLNATKIHCICAMLNNDEVTVYNFIGEDNVRQFEEWLLSEDVRTIVGHNIIGFDIPILRLVSGFKWNFAVRDTLVLSRLANPSLDGGHSLRNWGNKLGNFKDDYDGGWETYSTEMLKYCQQDVRVTKILYRHLEKQLEDVEEKAIDLEHEVFRIIKGQEDNGMSFDEAKAFNLLAELKEKVLTIEDKVHERFKPLPTFVELTVLKNPKRKDGTNSVAYQKQLDRGAFFQRSVWGYMDYPTFNLASRQQVARHLQHFGWKPKKFTDKGSIIVDEKALAGVDIPEAQLILEYFTISKRVAMVKSWIEAVDEVDSRVHGRVNSCGAVTGRMTHSKPNLAQVPASYSPYGKECRELWIVPKGKKLVGMDASGLELRMLAHYMNDKDYTEEILNGDIHTANQMAAGLQSRDSAKTFIYAFLYGAGDGKIGEVVGGTAKDGKKLKADFLNNTPSLRKLRGDVRQRSEKGWLRGLDGRKLWIRSPHLALNTLLQSAGAIVMKQALILLEKYAILYNIDFKFVLNVHDEIQSEVREDQAEQFGQLAVSCMQRAGQDFNLNCRLDGEYKVGETWEQTH
jgi:DNA polymerase-1